MKNHGIMTIMGAGAALLAADRAGILQRLSERVTPEHLAREAGLDPLALTRILEVFRAYGLLEREGDGYVATPHFVAELQGPSGKPGAQAFIFDHVDAYLKTGTTVWNGKTESRETTYPDVVGALARLFDAPAQDLAEVLALTDRDRPIRILDVGAGSGVWGLAQAQWQPNAKVTLLDLPNVLPRAMERAKSLGLESQVELLAGDYFALDLEKHSFDRIILANVLHLESAERAKTLLTRLAPALRPDGKFIIVDVMTTDSAFEDQQRSTYALHLALRMPGAQPHHVEVLNEWLTALGFWTRHMEVSQNFPGLSALFAER